ncbi:hypothetical protein TNCV_3266761 [Trichonephila clavipes]|nr:hypothetical protein TNCV_3266761 [Trichonephila clavipes]
MPSLPVPIDNVVNRVFIKSSALKQVVAIHSGMAADWADLVSSYAKSVKVYSQKVVSGVQDIVYDAYDFNKIKNMKNLYTFFNCARQKEVQYLQKGTAFFGGFEESVDEERFMVKEHSQIIDPGREERAHDLLKKLLKQRKLINAL